MLYSLFFSDWDLGILITGWNVYFYRVIFIAELALLLVGILFGAIMTNGKLKTGIISVVGAAGLLLILKQAVFGLSSDGEILVPFLGEILLVAAIAAAVSALCKKRRRSARTH